MCRVQVCGVQARWSLAVAATGGALLTTAALTAAIRAGGVGKNGSTVAVSTPLPTLSCYHVVMLYCHVG